MTLSDDDVRERFSAYHDGELPAEEAAVVRARLDASPELAKEYAAFRAMLTGLARLSLDTVELEKPGVTAPETPKVDLLKGVQKKLHKRSAGKFYRSRFARAAGVFPLEALAAVVLVLLVVVYVCMTYVSGLKPLGGAAPQRPQPAQRAP